MDIPASYVSLPEGNSVWSIVLKVGLGCPAKLRIGIIFPQKTDPWDERYIFVYLPNKNPPLMYLGQYTGFVQWILFWLCGCLRTFSMNSFMDTRRHISMASNHFLRSWDPCILLICSCVTFADPFLGSMLVWSIVFFLNRYRFLYKYVGGIPHPLTVK